MACRKQLSLFLMLFLISEVSLRGQASSAGPTPSEQLSKSQVLISVSDRDGNPVNSLSKDQIVAIADHKSVQVLELRQAKDEPLTFAVLVDVSGSTKGKAALEREAVVDLFRALTTKNNHGYLSFFNDLATPTSSYADLGQVEQALGHAQWGKGGTALYDAIIQSCTRVLSWKVLPNDPRRVLFVITDGEDNASRASLPEAIEQAQAAGVAIFTIRTNPTGRHGLVTIRDLTRETGGFALFVEKPGEFVQPLLTVLNEQYLLTLVEEKKGKLHSLELKSPNTAVKVLGPSRYYAPQ
jgi:VWFA-related protein